MCDRGKKSSLHTASRECVAPNMTRPWSSQTHRRQRADNGSGRSVNPVFMQQAGSVLHRSWHVREAVKMPHRLCDASWRTDLGEASDHKAHRVLQTKEVGLHFSVKLELKGSSDEEASTGLKCKTCTVLQSSYGLICLKLTFDSHENSCFVLTFQSCEYGSK